VANLPSIRSGKQSIVKVSTLQIYLRELARYPLLSPEEEYQLAVDKEEEGSVSAAHRLVTSNLRLVVKIANEFRNNQMNLLDLIQEGNYGLLQAVQRFNPYKSVKLSTYAAWWIRAYILKYLMDNRSQVKIATTAAQRKLFYNLKKETEKLLQQYETAETRLLAEKLDVREKDVEEMQRRLAGGEVPLDAPVGGEDSTITRQEMIPDTSDSVEDSMARDEVYKIFTEYLEEFRQTLKGRDAEIFSDRMLSENPATLQQIGDRYGVSRERARQLESRIFKNLREFVKSRGKLIDV
jgi:RNA polymerase sigma-32 factor